MHLFHCSAQSAVHETYNELPETTRFTKKPDLDSVSIPFCKRGLENSCLSKYHLNWNENPGGFPAPSQCPVYVAVRCFSVQTTELSHRKVFLRDMVIFSKPSWLRHATRTTNGPLLSQRGFGFAERPATAASARAGASSEGASIPIFSVDIQPCARDEPFEQIRLATSGQDGCIYLWRLSALWEDAKRQCSSLLETAQTAPSTAAEKENGTLRNDLECALLSVLSPAHQGAANVVRWHPGGKLLASGGDDGTVMLFVQAPLATEPFGRGTLLNAPVGVTSKESWTASAILRTHESDVLDISFAPRGDALASCSVDNSICVWRIELSNKHADQAQWVTASGHLVARLRGHEGMVKGISWDPTNQFIASQSDDRSVIIWRTDHWGEVEKSLRKEFEAATTEANLRAWFMRLAWSPSGAELVATNGYRNKCHVAPLYRRIQNFADPIEFVGHRAPVVSVRWSPCVYSRSPNPPYEGKNRLYLCVALGSKDRGLTIWRADHGKPFVSLVDLFDGDVLDLSWNAAGNVLVACSTDGSVFFAQFEPEELGHVVPESVARDALRKEMALFTGDISGLASGATANLGDANHGLLDPSVLAMTQHQSSRLPSTTGARKPRDDIQRGGTGMNISPPEQLERANVDRIDWRAANPIRLEDQREERRGDGKRRIIPVALDGQVLSVTTRGSAEENSDKQQLLAASQTEDVRAFGSGRVKKRHRTDAMSGTMARKLSHSTGEIPAGDHLIHRMHQRQKQTTAEPSRLACESALQKTSKRTFLGTVEESAARELPLDLPQGEGRQIWLISDAETDLVIESVSQSSNCTLVLGVKSGEQHWKQTLHGMIAAVAGSDSEAGLLVGTTDAALHVLSARSGMRLAPPLMLDAPAAWMTHHEKLAFVLTRSASFYVYDIVRLSRWYREREGRPLLHGTARFLISEWSHRPTSLPERFVWNSSRRILFLLLGNGDVYAYLADQEQWVRLMDDHFMASPYQRCGDGAKANPDPDTATDLATLNMLRAMIGHQEVSEEEETTDLLELADPQRETNETVAHLELLWLAASFLQNEAEQRLWLQKLVEKLVQQGDEARLAELCDQLVGIERSECSLPDDRSKLIQSERQPGTMLLQDVVLPKLAMNPSLESMLNTYRELLKMLDASRKPTRICAGDETKGSS
jgi:protein HIRA/HIR1